MSSVVKQALQELGVAGEFADYSQEQIDGVVEYVRDAPEITKFEGGNFSLHKKDKYYIIKKNDQLVGWLTLGDNTYDGQQYYTFELIYILPQFRKTKATLLLVYGVKELLDKPVIVDGMLFVDGKDLLNAVYARDRFKISTVDKKTGERTPYRPSDLVVDMDKNFVIIESTNFGFYFNDRLPGDPNHKICISLFEHLHDIEYS
jgi:hypothetical protein